MEQIEQMKGCIGKTPSHVKFSPCFKIKLGCVAHVQRGGRGGSQIQGQHTWRVYSAIIETLRGQSPNNLASHSSSLCL